MYDLMHHPWLQNYQKWKNRATWGKDSNSSSNASSLKDEMEEQEEESEGNFEQAAAATFEDSDC